jgi:2-phospho-L-lactate/phosphoenolpyruvate guanylyltransferase
MTPAAGGPDPAGTWAIIAVRGLERAKSRLGGPLDAEERLDLVSRLLRRAIEAATSSPGIAGTIVVSTDPAALELAGDAGAIPVADFDRGLNAALELARAEALTRRAKAVIVLPADLPWLDRDTLDALLEAAGDAATADRFVALVPDRHGTGTNVLVVAPPDAIDFAFGPGSRAAHAAEAAAAGASYVELGGPLQVDLDTPEDLVLVERLAPETIDVG